MESPAHSLRIDAPADRVFELVVDITRMSEWSPECERCWWVGAAADGGSPPAVGALFRGRSRNGWRRWTTTSTITAAVPGERFAFDVTYVGRPVATWTYELRRLDDGGTLLIEAAVDRRGPILRRVTPLITGTRDRRARNDETIAITLARIKAAAEEPDRRHE